MWRKWLIEKLGGYSDFRSALATVRELSLKERHDILTAAVRHRFNTIDQSDILRFVKGQWTWEGRPMSAEQVRLLKAEIIQYEGMFLKKVIDRELRYRANQKMFTLSQSELDIIAGKLLVYYIDIIDTRLKMKEE